MIYDSFQVTGAHDAVFVYADLFPSLFTTTTRSRIRYELDDILLSMTKIPPDDILESYKLTQIDDTC